MKDLETMQEKGREGFAEGCTPMNISDPPSDHEWINTFIDQHTANTWKAAQESMIDSMKNTTIDTYEISGAQYFKKADVRKLIKGEPFLVESSPKSDNRFDVPVNIGFK